MRAARWHGTRDLRVEDVEAPKIEPGRVIVKVRRAGICGTDLHDYAEVPTKSIPVDKPHPLTGHKAPIIMGHEFSGDVVEVGEGVTNVKVGDRVTCMPLHRCGKCLFLSAGAPPALRDAGRYRIAMVLGRICGLLYGQRLQPV